MIVPFAHEFVCNLFIQHILYENVLSARYEVRYWIDIGEYSRQGPILMKYSGLLERQAHNKYIFTNYAC